MKLFSLFSRLFYPRFNITPPHYHSANLRGPVPGNIGYRVVRKQIYASYSATPSDQYIVGCATATVTLPQASTCPAGQMIMVGNSSPGDFNITVDPYAGDTISNVDGTVVVGATLGIAMFISDGVDNWDSVTVAS